MMPPARPTVSFVGSRIRAALCVSILSLLVLASCSKTPRWDGQFTGKLEEKVDERIGLSEDTETKDSAVTENFTVTASSQGERDKMVRFGDCLLRFHSDKNPPGDTFQASPDQFCAFTINHYRGEFEVTGVALLNRNEQTGQDHLGLTLTGYSVESVPHTDKWKKMYSFIFQGERK